MPLRRSKSRASGSKSEISRKNSMIGHLTLSKMPSCAVSPRPPSPSHPPTRVVLVFSREPPLTSTRRSRLSCCQALRQKNENELKIQATVALEHEKELQVWPLVPPDAASVCPFLGSSLAPQISACTCATQATPRSLRPATPAPFVRPPSLNHPIAAAHFVGRRSLRMSSLGRRPGSLRCRPKCSCQTKQRRSSWTPSLRARMSSGRREPQGELAYSCLRETSDDVEASPAVSLSSILTRCGSTALLFRCRQAETCQLLRRRPEQHRLAALFFTPCSDQAFVAYQCTAPPPPSPPLPPTPS